VNVLAELVHREIAGSHRFPRMLPVKHLVQDDTS
jgi:hypothetical protein